jgi:glycosyltransferase involved in cell wall biosynthesis
VPVAAGAAERRIAIADSLAKQDFDDWELVIASSDSVASLGVLADRTTLVELDRGCTLADALNAGIGNARGEFLTILGADCVLDSTALGAVCAAIDGKTDVLYTDEVIAGTEFKKPDFSAERLRSQFYLGDLTAYRMTTLRAIGGVRPGVDGAEEYDLALRATRAARKVVHLDSTLVKVGSPTIAHGWGTPESAMLEATRRVLHEHLGATGGGIVDEVRPSGVHRTRRLVQGNPLVSIVIPTRGDRATIRGAERCMVVEAIRGIVERSSYTNLEFVVIIDEVADDGVREALRGVAGDRLLLVEWSRPFNFSEKINLGVLRSRGEYVVLLNDDVEVITESWIEAMLALAQRPMAGLVGAMLYFEDDTIQHAGHAYYRLDVTHIGLNSERGAKGPWGGFLLEREVVGVTCACALVRREVFIEAGGLSTLLPGNFNDVDLCMKVATLGYQSYWTPFAELYHFESKSRDPRVARSEIDIAWGRWESFFWRSPFWPTDPHERFGPPPIAIAVVDSPMPHRNRESGGS